MSRARICKRLRSPGIKFKILIPPGLESIHGLLKRFTNTDSVLLCLGLRCQLVFHLLIFFNPPPPLLPTRRHRWTVFYMMVFEYESIPQLTWWRHIPAVTPLETGDGGGGGGNWIGMGLPPERCGNARKLTRIRNWKRDDGCSTVAVH